MSERSQREKTLQKIRKENPYITNEATIVDMAIAADRGRESCFGLLWIAGSILFLVVMLLLAVSGETAAIAVCAFIGFFGNGVRLLVARNRVVKRYRPVLRLEDNGDLTQEKILMDCKKELRTSQGQFFLVKAPLYDMEARYDPEFGKIFSRWFTFCIDGKCHEMKVKAREYRRAVLDTYYYLVVPYGKTEPVKAYQVGSWKIPQELAFGVRELQPAVAVPQPPVERADTFVPQDASGYAPAMPVIREKKPQKLLPIVSLILSALAMLLPYIVSPVVGVAALVLAILGIVKERNGWSIAALVTSIVILAIEVCFVLPEIISSVF